VTTIIRRAEALQGDVLLADRGQLLSLFSLPSEDRYREGPLAASPTDMDGCREQGAHLWFVKVIPTT